MYDVEPNKVKLTLPKFDLQFETLINGLQNGISNK